MAMIKYSQGSYDFPDFPPIVHLESSIICNASCIFCPTSKIMRSQPRPIYMADTLWKKIIDQFPANKVERMSPFLNGEPFVDPNLYDVMRYCKTKSPSTVISLYTNGMFATKDKVLKAIDAGLGYVHFSLGGYSPTTWESIQRGINACNVVDNVVDFISYVKDYPQVKYAIAMTMTKENEHELEQFKFFWKGFGVEDVEGNWVTNRDQAEFVAGKYNTSLNRKSDAPCLSVLFNHLYVLTNGDVVFCCEDAFGVVVVGNLVHQTVEEVWHGEKLNYIRRIHLEKRKNEIKGLCDTCVVVH